MKGGHHLPNCEPLAEQLDIIQNQLALSEMALKNYMERARNPSS